MPTPEDEYVQANVPIEIMTVLDQLDEEKLVEVLYYIKKRLKEKLNISVYVFTDLGFEEVDV